MRLSYNAAYLMGHIEQVLLPKIKKAEQDIERQINEMQNEYDSLPKFKKFFTSNPKWYSVIDSPFYFDSMLLNQEERKLQSYLKTFKNHRLIDPVVLETEDIRFLKL